LQELGRTNDQKVWSLKRLDGTSGDGTEMAAALSIGALHHRFTRIYTKEKQWRATAPQLLSLAIEGAFGNGKGQRLRKKMSGNVSPVRA